MLQAHLNNEKRTLSELKQVYTQALKDCEKRIKELSMRTDMENIQSIVYQKNYQQAIKGQLEGILEQLHSNEFATVSDFLARSYQDGYIGAMYDISGQGIPLIIPLDQEQVVKAIQTDTKLSKTLYNRLGEDINKLKTNIRAEVSRGIANGSTWNEVASQIAMNFKNTPFNVAYNNAVRIARTEGHRIQIQAADDAQHKAKDNGADIVKMWDASLDGKTRKTHRKLDGQIRELDEPFEVDGKKAMRPADFGDPAEDINCRCALLQRARWALDESELEVLKSRAEYYGLDKTDSFEDYKKKYLKASDDVAKDRLGIFSNNKKTNPKYYDYKGKDISTVENDLSSLDYEVGVIFDDDGKAISCQLGSENEVRFTKHQAKLMKGKDVTHNHPLNTPPSPEDLYLMVNNKAKSFRTCGKNGAYVLKYSEDVEKLPIYDVFSNKYDEVSEKLKPKYINEIVKGMAQEEATIKWAEEIWEELYKLYGIKPDFERR